jgi:hypothetical protein
MTSRWRQFVAWGNIFFTRRWPIIAFQPILYLFLWGAFLRLAASPKVPASFAHVISDAYYQMWLGLGLVSPPLALLSWWLITHCRGLLRYRGMWFRLAADIGMFTSVLAYHLVVVLNNPVNESRMFSRYIVAACMVFMLTLIVRDMWALQLTEQVARRIHRGRG